MAKRYRIFSVLFLCNWLIVKRVCNTHVMPPFPLCRPPVECFRVPGRRGSLTREVCPPGAQAPMLWNSAFWLLRIQRPQTVLAFRRTGGFPPFLAAGAFRRDGQIDLALGDYCLLAPVRPGHLLLKPPAPASLRRSSRPSRHPETRRRPHLNVLADY